MLVMSKAREPRELDLSRFPEMIRPGDTAVDVMTGERQVLGRTLTLPARSVTVLTIE